MSHFIVKILNQIKPKEIKVIPQNMERYTAFIVENLEFLDSYQFLAALLANLDKNLPVQESKCLNAIFKNLDERNLVRQKGFFSI